MKALFLGFIAAICFAQAPQSGTGVPGPAGPAGSGASTPATTAPVCGTGVANTTQACTASPIVTAIGSTPVANATNAASATTLAGTPTLCPSGQAPIGILPNGNATGCAVSGGTLTASGIGAAGAAGANRLTGPPNAVVGMDSSGDSIDVTRAVTNVSGKTVLTDIQSPRDPNLGGALGDGRQSNACTWSAAGTSVSCSDTVFTAGKLIVLRQAGAGVPGSNGSAPYSSLYAFQDVSTSISSVTGTGVGNTANLATALTTASGSGTGIVVWGTDDQAALTTGFSVPGNLTIPAGIFMHSGILSMVSGLNLFCSPGSIFQATTAANAAFSIQSGVANVSINNCTTQSIVTSRNAAGNSSGVLISNASLTVAPFNILLNNLTVNYFSGSGMYISAGNSIKILGGLVDTVLSNSLYVAGGAGAGATGITGGVYMSGHTARNIGDMAWEFTSSSSTTQTAYGTVDSNTVENSLAGGGLSDGSAHIIFQNNRVKNVVASGFTCFIDSFSPVFSPTDCQVNNNYIENADSLGSGTNGGVLIINLAGGKFQGNEIRDSTGFGLEERQTSPSSQLVIQHNKFINLGKQAIHITGNATGVDIQNNTATSTGPLLQIEQQTAPVQNCTIKGNSGRSITVGSTTFAAIDIVGAVNCNGSGNDVQSLIGGAAGVIRVSGATNSTVTTTQTPNLPLSQPAAPTVTPTGGASGSYTYAAVCYLPDGTNSAGGLTTSIANGPTSLGASNYNTITPAAEINATQCAIYRTAGGSTQGKLPGYVAPLVALVDNGLVADGSTLPTGGNFGIITAANCFYLASGAGTSGLCDRGSGNTSWNAAGTAKIILSNSGVLQFATPLLPNTSGTQSVGSSSALFGNGYFVNLLVSGLTPGNCMQAGTGGLLTTTGAPCASGFSTAAVSLTPGTNITSVTCTSAACDVNGGSITVVAGALATTGTFATVSYTALATAPRVCQVSMNGGAAFLGLGHGAPSTTSFTLTSAVSIAATTFSLDYTCKP